MHTQIALPNLIFWAILIAVEFALALYARHQPAHYLQRYLLAESAIGATLWVFSRTIPAWPYFYCWCVGTVADEAVTLYLLIHILRQLQLRALPSRKHSPLIPLAGTISIAVGAYSSGFAVQAAKPSLHLILSWDALFWSGASCMVAFLPLYAFFSLSSFPSALRLTFLALAIYVLCHTGFLDLYLVSHQMAAFVVSDAIYLCCLLLWFFALRQYHAGSSASRAS